MPDYTAIAAQSGVGVLDKAMLLLAAIESGPASLATLVERLGLSRATTHRLAQALELHGVVRRDEDGRFALGPRCITLGNQATAAFPLAKRAAPVLEALRDRTGESVQLYVAETGGRRCVLALDSTHELRTIVPPGALLPLDKGSAGRVLRGDDPGRRGWIETAGERQAGVASVSAPVRGLDGDVIAAVSVSGPIDRIGASPGGRHGPAVAKAARALSKLL